MYKFILIQSTYLHKTIFVQSTQVYSSSREEENISRKYRVEELSRAIECISKIHKLMVLITRCMYLVFLENIGLGTGENHPIGSFFLWFQFFWVL